MVQHHNSGDGVAQRINSPRYSGPMTRRAHSFKRNPNNSQKNGGNAAGNSTGGGSSGASPSYSSHHEIDVLNSPGSDIVGQSTTSFDAFDRQVGSHVSQRVHLRSLWKKPAVGSIVLELGLREKKKLGHWMFLLFCGVCLFLGVFRICVYGWFGSAIEKAASNQDLSDFSTTQSIVIKQGGQKYDSRKGSNDVERTLKMVSSSVVGDQNDMADVSGPSLTVRISPSVLVVQEITKSQTQRQMDIFSSMQMEA